MNIRGQGAVDTKTWLLLMGSLPDTLPASGRDPLETEG